MELMINALLREGARRSRLEAKVFGGARMISGLRNIGQDNAAFAFWFLENENIRCVGTSIGGTRARKVRFWPSTGQAQQQYVREVVEPTVRTPSVGAPAAGTVTFF